MKALVTLESGKMFRVDIHGHLLTAIDKTGRPMNTKFVERIPIMVPGRPLIFASGEGTETAEGIVAHIIYFR